MMRMRSRRPVVAMNVRWLFTLFLLTALFYLQDAASEDSRDDCNSGDVKFISNTAGFQHIPGDALGFIDVCEGQIWKNIILCEKEWTRENTVVACRQLGYGQAGSFVVDSSSTVIEGRRRLSYRPQCTGMEERLVNCTQIYTQCEGYGERVVISCWNSSRDSSQTTLSVTTHTLAVQTSTITSIAMVPSSVSSTVPSSVSSAVPSSVSCTVPSSVSSAVPSSVSCTVPSSVSCTVPSSVSSTVPSSVSSAVPSSVSCTVPSSVSSTVLTSAVAMETGSVSKVPSFTPYTPTNPATEATSDTGRQLVVVGSVAGVAGVVTVSALVLVVVVVVVCAVWRNRRGHRRSDDEGESREMEMNPAYQTTASLTSATTNPAYQTTASLTSAYMTTASLTSHSPHLYEDVFHCQ